MRSLVVSRGTFEISRALLNKRSLLIGRSPTCDIVLRAPDVKPIHFLVEWIGQGEFDPTFDQWIISDISRSNIQKPFGEGTLLDILKAVELAGFKFSIEETSYSNSALLGGNINRELTAEKQTFEGSFQEKLLEVVWIRSPSGHVEDVIHLRPKQLSKKRIPFSRIPKLKLQWTSSATMQVLHEGMENVQVIRKGEVVASDSTELKLNDILEMRWKRETFFLRFVSQVKVPVILQKKSDFLLMKVGFASSALFSLVLAFSLFTNTKIEDPAMEPPRIVRVEISEVISPPPVAAAASEIVEEVVKTPELKAGLKEITKNVKAAAAAASRVNSEDGAARMGLNSPAKSTDVNQVGVLGMLNMNRSAKGAGVKADLIINQGIQSRTLAVESATGIVVKNPPIGVVGAGSGGNPNGVRGSIENLAATTTLRGVRKSDPTSLGAIATQGGISRSGLGTSLSGQGKGVSGSMTSSLFDNGELSVIGGLDKETVRRVIAGYRGKVRICYDKSLVGNPKVNGRVVYKWLISSPGPVSQVNIAKTLVSSQTLEQCVLGVIHSMVFPKAANGRPTTVIYPFEFFSKN